MAANDKYFVPPEATETLLRVRGFGANGLRSGGIEAPQIVELPAGSVLFRMYHDPNRDYGEWWATPRELGLIADYFGRRGPVLPHENLVRHYDRLEVPGDAVVAGS